MLYLAYMGHYLHIRANIALGLIFAFLANSLGPVPQARADEDSLLLAHQSDSFVLPEPGTMVHLSPEFNPPILKGIKVHPDNPFKFEFILDKGDSQLGNDQLKEESRKLIKYFLASLTIPEKDLWVNLSPYEKDRIIPQSFGLTEMGRDLLAEDYMLKQITASLIYPEDTVGKKFWKRIYEEAKKKFGTTNIPVNTFNKVWIVPEKAVVYENAKAGTAYVVESKLKVMLEQDYLSLQKHEGIQSDKAQVQNTNQLGSQIVREVVIPELTKEVNENKNFSHLRQVYNSLILATWYKKKIKDSILDQVYENKNKIAGVNIDDPQEKEKIYRRYLQAFKKGVFNYIKEEAIPDTGLSSKEQGIFPRKYFSGGETFDYAALAEALRFTSNEAVFKQLSLDHAMLITAKIQAANNKAVPVNAFSKTEFTDESSKDSAQTTQVPLIRSWSEALEALETAPLVHTNSIRSDQFLYRGVSGKEGFDDIIKTSLIKTNKRDNDYSGGWWAKNLFWPLIWATQGPGRDKVPGIILKMPYKGSLNAEGTVRPGPVSVENVSQAFLVRLEPGVDMEERVHIVEIRLPGMGLDSGGHGDFIPRTQRPVDHAILSTTVDSIVKYPVRWANYALENTGVIDKWVTGLDAAMQGAGDRGRLTSKNTFKNRLDGSINLIRDMLQGTPDPVIYDIGIGYGQDGPSTVKELAAGIPNSTVLAIDNHNPDYQVMTPRGMVLYDISGKILSIQTGRGLVFTTYNRLTAQYGYFKQLFNEILKQGEKTGEFKFKGKIIKVIYKPMRLHEAPNIQYLSANLFNLKTIERDLSQHKADLVRIANVIKPKDIPQAIEQLTPYVNEGGILLIGGSSRPKDSEQTSGFKKGEKIERYLVYRRKEDGHFELTQYATEVEKGSIILHDIDLNDDFSIDDKYFVRRAGDRAMTTAFGLNLDGIQDLKILTYQQDTIVFEGMYLNKGVIIKILNPGNDERLGVIEHEVAVLRDAYALEPEIAREHMPLLIGFGHLIAPQTHRLNIALRSNGWYQRSDSFQLGQSYFVEEKEADEIPIDRIKALPYQDRESMIIDELLSVAIALRKLNAAGFFHRDLGTHEIRYSTGGEIKFLDWGFSDSPHVKLPQHLRRFIKQFVLSFSDPRETYSIALNDNRRRDILLFVSNVAFDLTELLPWGDKSEPNEGMPPMLRYFVDLRNEMDNSGNAVGIEPDHLWDDIIQKLRERKEELLTGEMVNKASQAWARVEENPKAEVLPPDTNAPDSPAPERSSIKERILRYLPPKIKKIFLRGKGGNKDFDEKKVGDRAMTTQELNVTQLNTLISDRGYKGAYLFVGYGGRAQFKDLGEMERASEQVVKEFNDKYGEGKWLLVYGGDPANEPSIGYLVKNVKDNHPEIPVLAIQAEKYREDLIKSEFINFVYFYPTPKKDGQGNRQYAGFDEKTGSLYGATHYYLGHDFVKSGLNGMVAFGGGYRAAQEVQLGVKRGLNVISYKIEPKNLPENGSKLGAPEAWLETLSVDQKKNVQSRDVPNAAMRVNKPKGKAGDRAMKTDQVKRIMDVLFTQKDVLDMWSTADIVNEKYDESVDKDLLASLWEPHFQQIINESGGNIEDFIKELEVGKLSSQLTSQLKDPLDNKVEDNISGIGDNRQNWDHEEVRTQLKIRLKSSVEQFKKPGRIEIVLGGTLIDEVINVLGMIDEILHEIAGELQVPYAHGEINGWKISVRALNIETACLVNINKQLNKKNVLHKEWVKLEYMNLMDPKQWERLSKQPADVFFVTSSLYLGAYFKRFGKRVKDEKRLNFIRHVVDFVKPGGVFITEVPNTDENHQTKFYAPLIPGFNSIITTTYRSATPERSGVYVKEDKAMTHTGGIDLTPANEILQSQNNGIGIKFHMDAAMLKRLQGAPGFTVGEITIQPLKSLPVWLGISQAQTNSQMLVST